MGYLPEWVLAGDGENDSWGGGRYQNPGHGHTSPFYPFYDSGDYTCIKDAQAEYWDQAGTTGSNAGCYRMVQGGARYSAGRWTGGNVTDLRTTTDLCNQYYGGTLIGVNWPGG